MSYIIVWRDSYRDPHIQTNNHGFKESFGSYQDAKDEAEMIFESENEDQPSPHYTGYKIYEETNS